MDISRLQLRSSSSTVSSLPPGLRTPVVPTPAVQPTAPLRSLMPDGDGPFPAQVFDRFAAAWKARLDRFLAEDPTLRA